MSMWTVGNEESRLSEGWKVAQRTGVLNKVFLVCFLVFLCLYKRFYQ